MTKIQPASAGLSFGLHVTSADSDWLIVLKTQSSYISALTTFAACVDEGVLAPELLRIAYAAPSGVAARRSSVSVSDADAEPTHAAPAVTHVEQARERIKSESLEPVLPSADVIASAISLDCSPRILVEQLLQQISSKLGLPFTSFPVDELDMIVCGVNLGDCVFVLQARGLHEFLVSPSRNLIEVMFVQDCLREGQPIVLRLVRFTQAAALQQSSMTEVWNSAKLSA